MKENNFIKFLTVFNELLSKYIKNIDANQKKIELKNIYYNMDICEKKK